ncbi:hypothetical protein NA56DRAFT_645595 [Hyaloscypha hepaticicola]|uniref:Fungal N-terminal domain-containing protein n=1 Tax=Hyaloscypha hepaticicola TaxID=2082293 RepID=A0A2J6Q4V9_9HELO|nr:hypothetical protein NA56DRAFT_645595 [Hyaloscypha hepaticicola]
MDGWSIFAAAGTLAQFVIIASTLLSQAAEIRGSAGGASDEVLSLESVYGNLQKLSQGLKTSFQGRASIDVELKESADELAELAGTCKKDCDHLLEIIAECKVGEATNGRWKSMRKAARFLWRSREIKGLEQRLERAQRSLDLRFAIISNYYHRHHSSYLEKLKGESEELHVRQSEKFRELRDMLRARLEYLLTTDTSISILVFKY